MKIEEKNSLFTALFFIFFSIFLSTACKTEAKTGSLFADSIHDVKIHIDNILETKKPEDVLVVFDVDMTLIQPNHPATYLPTLKKYRIIFQNITQKLTNLQRDNLLTLTTKIPQQLIENNSPAVVKYLQNRKVNVIGFTASLTGHRDDHINKPIFKFRDMLRSFGFNFSFPHRTVVSYMSFPKHNNGYPIFYHGVLCSNGENNSISKGKIFSAFLRQVGRRKAEPYGSGYIPKIIVMVDAKQLDTDNIKGVLAKDFPDVQFIGIQYRGAFHYAPKDISESEFTEFWTQLTSQAKCITTKKQMKS